MTYAAWEGRERLPVEREDFERVNRAYLDGNPWLQQNFNFAAHSAAQVLEVGCGAGSATCLFAASGAEVTAIDLTEQAVRVTQENVRLQGFDGVSVLRMDAEHLDFPDARFDFVYAWGVIHHSSAPEQAFAELSRVLRPGGNCLIMVYNRTSLRYWLKGLYWLLLKRKLIAGETIETVQRFFTDGFYHKHYTAKEFDRLLYSCGLVKGSTTVTHMAKRMVPCLPRPVDDFLKRRWGWLLVVQAFKPLRAT